MKQKKEESIMKELVDKTVEQIRENMQTYVEVFPTEASQNNRYGTMTIDFGWTQSFWTGMLWLAYELTGDQSFRKLAQYHTGLFQRRLVEEKGLDTHDLGFLYSLSCVADYKLTGSQKAKKTAIKAADHLLKRWKDKGQFIQAWGDINDPENYRLIIDCYMNLPLLIWAAEVTGNKRYKEVALAHAYTAKEVVLRPDYSTHHTFYFDPKTGDPVKGVTAQGYSDTSSWARGQAWAIYGFALCYRWTKDPAFWEAFVHVTDYFIDHLPADQVPYWDLVFTDGEEERDSSAGAIAICGMLEMASLVGREKGKKYYQVAKRIMDALSNDYTAFDLTEANGLLLHGVYSKPDGNGVDEMQIWGDYFFLEAIRRFKGDWKSYW